MPRVRPLLRVHPWPVALFAFAAAGAASWIFLGPPLAMAGSHWPLALTGSADEVLPPEETARAAATAQPVPVRLERGAPVTVADVHGYLGNTCATAEIRSCLQLPGDLDLTLFAFAPPLTGDILLESTLADAGTWGGARLAAVDGRPGIHAGGVSPGVSSSGGSASGATGSGLRGGPARSTADAVNEKAAAQAARPGSNQGQTSAKQGGAFYPNIGVPPVWAVIEPAAAVSNGTDPDVPVRVPEPSTLLLAGLGAAGLAGARSRHQRRR